MANATNATRAIQPTFEDYQENEQQHHGDGQVGKDRTEHLPMTEGLDESHTE